MLFSLNHWKSQRKSSCFSKIRWKQINLEELVLLLVATTNFFDRKIQANRLFASKTDNKTDITMWPCMCESPSTRMCELYMSLHSCVSFHHLACGSCELCLSLLPCANSHRLACASCVYILAYASCVYILACASPGP